MVVGIMFPSFIFTPHVSSNAQNLLIRTGTSLVFIHFIFINVCVIYFILAKCTMSICLLLDTKDIDSVVSARRPSSGHMHQLVMFVYLFWACIYCCSVAQNTDLNTKFQFNFHLILCRFISVLPSFV